jgi:hypothetical protein
MAKQVTINQSFYKKMDALRNDVKEKVWSKGEEVVSYAAAISPIQTGAFIESFSVVARGAGGGRSRTSNNKPILADKEGKKMDEAARLRAEVRAIDPLEENGFTLRNRAPHANEVEKKHNVFLRTGDRFR